MNDKKKGKLPLLLIFLTVFIDLIGFGIIIPLMPQFAEKFGASGLTIGLLLMSYSLMQFFFAPFWGRLSDKVGRRPVLLISLAASAAGYLIWGFADSLWMLFLSRIVAGFGNANLAVAQAYIADVTSEEDRSKGMGLVGAAFGLGFTLGPAIGGICAHLGFQHNTVGFVAAAFSIVDLVLTACALPEPAQRKRSGHDPFSLGTKFYIETVTNKKLVKPLLIAFVSTFAFANMEATLVLLTGRFYNFDMAMNSWMFMYIGIVMVIVQGGLIRRLSKKYDEAPLVSIGCALVAVGLLLTPATRSIGVLYVALALLAIGSGINNPSNNSLISKLADPEHVGGVMGVGQSLTTLGRILGPVAGGLLFDKFGPASPYALGASAMVVAFFLSLQLPRLKRSEDKTARPAEAAHGKNDSEARQHGREFHVNSNIEERVERLRG